ncbi:MAG: prepilin-type N-terminal cleavage/methylation domain-containing protein [Deltaproteobacteria bacterium]|nr:prepilin-type N-terminal cleavage/methylation domain-containing protein [Deltaproteobacteria bacterium]
MITPILTAGKIKAGPAGGGIRRGARNSAFTLVEMIVVVAVMTLGLSLFLGLNHRQRESLVWRTKLRELQVFFKAARSHAILQRRSNDCLFNPESGGLREQLDRRRVQLGPGVEIELTAAQQAFLEAAANAEPRQEGAMQAEVSLLTFYADGGASGAPIRVFGPRSEAEFTVNPLTGGITFTERLRDDGEVR